MFSWLASFFVFFLHNDPAQVNASQPASLGSGTTQSLHADAINGNVPVGTGNSNGGPSFTPQTPPTP
jgi:hypothetical protein